MKYHYISDVHLDFNARHIQDFIPAVMQQGWVPSENTLIVAGDISPHVNQSVLFLTHSATFFKDVLFVLGNHDYMDTGLQGTRKAYTTALELVNLPNLHWLDNSEVILEGVRFVGGTMWTDYYSSNELQMSNCKRFMPELKCFPINGVIQENRVFEDFVGKISKEVKTLPTVCITHHLPSDECIDSKYNSSPINGGFSNRVPDDIIGAFDIWIHGHTHTEVNLNIEGTNVVANPAGYPGEIPSYTSSYFTLDKQYRVAIIDGDVAISESSSNLSEALRISQSFYERGIIGEPEITLTTTITLEKEEFKSW